MRAHPAERFPPGGIHARGVPGDSGGQGRGREQPTGYRGHRCGRRGRPGDMDGVRGREVERRGSLDDLVQGIHHHIHVPLEHLPRNDAGYADGEPDPGVPPQQGIHHGVPDQQRG